MSYAKIEQKTPGSELITSITTNYHQLKEHFSSEEIVSIASKGNDIIRFGAGYALFNQNKESAPSIDENNTSNYKM